MDIIFSGDVAVLVHDPHPCMDEHAGVRRMSDSERRALAQFDSVTTRWITEERTHGRVFVVWQMGTFLFNVDLHTGQWSLEPGSTDSEAS